jgi:hypothetical protein
MGHVWFDASEPIHRARLARIRVVGVTVILALAARQTNPALEVGHFLYQSAGAGLETAIKDYLRVVQHLSWYSPGP